MFALSLPDVRRPLRVALATLVLSFAAQARADQLVIVAGPSAGREASRTDAMFATATEAITALNASGGVNGETLAVERIDDGCARDTAAAAAALIAARKPALILGHPCAPAAIAAAEVYGKASILFVATATRAPALTVKRAGATIFRLSGRDDGLGETAGRLLSGAPFGAAVAIVLDRSQRSGILAKSAAAIVKRERGAGAITAAIVGGDKDYRRTVAKLKTASVIFFTGMPLEGGLLYSQLRAAGSRAEFIATDAFATAEFANTFGAGVHGIRALVSSAAWREAMPQGDVEGRARADVDLRFEALRVKAAITVFAAAAAKAQSNEPLKITEALANGFFVSPLGPISFTTDGDALIPSYQLIEWSGDSWGEPNAAPSQ